MKRSNASLADGRPARSAAATRRAARRSLRLTTRSAEVVTWGSVGMPDHYGTPAMRKPVEACYSDRRMTTHPVRTRTLGHSGLALTTIGLGTWAMGGGG